MQSIFKILMQGPLEKDSNRISTRFSHKDLYEIMQGHLEDFTRASSRSSHKDPYKIMLRQDLDQDLHARTHERSSQACHQITFC